MSGNVTLFWLAFMAAVVGFSIWVIGLILVIEWLIERLGVRNREPDS